jgi:hypothetical protein
MMHYQRQAANSHHRLSFIILVFEVVFSTLYADVKELFPSLGRKRPEGADVYGSARSGRKTCAFAKVWV